MKSTGGPGALMFAVTIGLAVGGGAFFWLRQGDQEKIRKLESNYERMEARCNRAYEELDRVGQGATGDASRQDSGAQGGMVTTSSNFVLRADFDALQQSNATLQTSLDGRAASNATLLARLNAVTASNATLQAEYAAIQASNVLLQVAGTATPRKDPVLQSMYDEAVKSNAHLQAEYEIVLQINDILRTEQGGLKSNSVSRLQFDDMQRSNHVLQAQYEVSCRSNLALRAECDALLLKAKADQSQVKEANASQQKELEILVSSNAVLVAACEKSAQQNRDLEEKYERLKDGSVDRATYAATIQSNIVLQAQSESVSRSNQTIRAEYDALLLKAKADQSQVKEENASQQKKLEMLVSSNAVLVAACEKSAQQNRDLEEKYERLKEGSVDRATYAATIQSNIVLQAQSESVSRSNQTIRAECDALLLKARVAQTQTADENTSLREEVDALQMSNAVLVVACEKAVQQNIELESQYNQLKDDSVGRADYDVSLQSNLVLRAEQSKFLDTIAKLQSQVDSTLMSNAVLKAVCAQSTRLNSELEARYSQLKNASIDQSTYNAALQSNVVLKAEQSRLLDDTASLRAQVNWTLQSNAVLRTANAALKVSAVPRATYVSTVQSNAVLKAELSSLTKRHVMQTKRYIKLGDRFVLLKQTHEKAEALLKAYRTRFLRQQEQSQKARRKTTR